MCIKLPFFYIKFNVYIKKVAPLVWTEVLKNLLFSDRHNFTNIMSF